MTQQKRTACCFKKINFRWKFRFVLSGRWGLSKVSVRRCKDDWCSDWMSLFNVSALVSHQAMKPRNKYKFSFTSLLNISRVCLKISDESTYSQSLKVSLIWHIYKMVFPSQLLKKLTYLSKHFDFNDDFNDILL